jgi:hypothetical protein
MTSPKLEWIKLTAGCCDIPVLHSKYTRICEIREEVCIIAVVMNLHPASLLNVICIETENKPASSFLE